MSRTRRPSTTSSTPPWPTSLPAAATAVTAVGAAEKASAQDRDPLSALGATLLGVDDRATTAGALLDEGKYAEATRPPTT